MLAPMSATLVNGYGTLLSDDQIQRLEHRSWVGGHWNALGALQLDYLIAHGLTPNMRLLDFGCGCLRAGIHFIRFLKPGRYYGLDLNRTLLKAGYDLELKKARLQKKLPPSNLLCDDNFRFDAWNVTFDMAIAQSVYTHLTLNHIRHSLLALAPCMARGAKFFATFYEVRDAEPIARPKIRPNGIRTYTDRDPYHYRASDLEWCATGLAWRFEYLGEWGHPLGQKMVSFARLS